MTPGRIGTGESVLVGISLADGLLLSLAMSTSWPAKINAELAEQRASAELH